MDVGNILTNFTEAHKKTIAEMNNFDQAALAKDVVYYLKANVGNVEKLKSYENGLVEFIKTIRLENAKIALDSLQKGVLDGWAGVIWKSFPELGKLKVDLANARP